MAVERLSEHGCFTGRQFFCRHQSRATGTAMNFSVFLPGAANSGEVPAIYYLAGLTCSEETFMIKAGAQRIADELGLALVSCDTSPRGLELPGEHDDWDFGSGAGFYLDASQAPWSEHYNMASYIAGELPALVEAEFPVSAEKRGIMGHSMGGHGALVTALRNPQQWQSVSAFAPISNPCAVPWGRKAFSAYLGENEDSWKDWDACELLSRQSHPSEILVDQGLADTFLERELHPQSLQTAANAAGQKLTLRLHEGFDHGYYFIQSFIEDHLRHHAQTLSHQS